MRIYSYAQEGYAGHVVTVEIDVHRGIPGFTIVGLAGGAVREAKDRVRVAMTNSDYNYPLDRIVVNLAPGDLPKVGSNYDLAIASALLWATGQLHVPNFSSVMILGELHLDGSVGAVTGVVPAIDEGIRQGIDTFIVPEENYAEALILNKGIIIPLHSLRQLTDLNQRIDNNREAAVAPAQIPTGTDNQTSDIYTLSALRGVPHVKRALVIAAAGGHHVFLVGPPGCGKTLAAKCLPSILPPLTNDEAIETTRIYSLIAMPADKRRLITEVPVRMPHHSISYAGMVGGGPKSTPGEAAQAHNGILLLDEVLEFRRDVLQSLRQPLEDRELVLVRAARVVTYPCSFQLIMTANACPCANLGRSKTSCFCKYEEIVKYWKRLGGAFLDRVPIRIAIMKNNQKNDSAESVDEYTQDDMSAQVKRAISAQKKRYHGTRIRRNGFLRSRQVLKYCCINDDLTVCLESHIRDHALSMRAQSQILTVARTIADVDGSTDINMAHLQEAMHLQNLSSSFDSDSLLQEIDRFIS